MCFVEKNYIYFKIKIYFSVCSLNLGEYPYKLEKKKTICRKIWNVKKSKIILKSLWQLLNWTSDMTVVSSENKTIMENNLKL